MKRCLFLMLAFGLFLASGNALAGSRQKDRFVSPAIGAEFVLIPAGTFMMGSPPDEKGRGNDEVRHQVMITKPFYIQATEVTQGQWKKVMGKNPSKFDQCGDNCPVEMVSFNDVQEFIKILNLAEGTDKYRLPTEAEWEYAARAGGTGPFGLIGASRLNSAELEDRQFKNSVQKYLKMGDMPPLPEESRKYLVQAMDAFEMKNLQRSADLYNRVLETAPWWADGHRDRALILSELGMYKEAVIEMNRYIFLDPDASDARISQDRSYMWEGRIDSLPEGQSPGVNNEALIDKLCWHHGNSGAKTQPAAMKSPNRWACTICMETCGNGVRTGTDRILQESLPIQQALRSARSKCFAAALGTVVPDIAGPRFAIVEVLPTGRITSDSGWSECPETRHMKTGHVMNKTILQTLTKPYF